VRNFLAKAATTGSQEGFCSKELVYTCRYAETQPHLSNSLSFGRVSRCIQALHYILYVCLNKGSYWPQPQQCKQLMASTSDNKRNFIFAYTLSTWSLSLLLVWIWSVVCWDISSQQNNAHEEFIAEASTLMQMPL
jgi:hypothetical protein